MTDGRWAELLWRYVELVGGQVPWMVGLALLAVLWVRAPRRRGVDIAGLLVAVGIGAGWAWSEMSLVDDAFISFRYARNLLDGHGLVFNPGEAVLGITNLGWTLCLAVGSAITGASIPHVALVLGAVAFAVAVGLVASLGHRPWIAAALFAVQASVTSFATTGLESLAATALVLGAWLALRHGRWMLAGWILLGATLLRLDHGLFAVAATLWVVWERPRDAWRLWLPFLLVPLVLAWSTWTYGDPLPNTFYAKSVADNNAARGAFYVATFWLGAHLWWLLPMVGVALWKGPRGESLFVGSALVIWHLYVLQVGGDFMYGRFLLPVLPLVLVTAEAAVMTAAGPPQILGAVALLCTARGVPTVPPRDLVWDLCDEGSVHQVATLSPLRVRHHSWGTGALLGELFTDRDIHPVLATHGIGMVGYLSRLEVIDILGLTDAHVARAPIEERGRPGHERRADPAYLRHRGVSLSRHAPHGDFRSVTALWVHRRPTTTLRTWHLYRWDPALVAQMRDNVPELSFVDADEWVRTLAVEAPDRPRGEVCKALDFLDDWYFPQQSRPDLRAQIAARCQGSGDGATEPRGP